MTADLWEGFDAAAADLAFGGKSEEQLLADEVSRLRRHREAQRIVDAELGDGALAGLVDAEVQRLTARLEAQRKVAEQTQAAREAGGLDGLDLSRVVAGDDFLFGGDAELEPLWGTPEQTLWAAGEALMIHGPQGTGKTTLAQQLVKALLGLSDEVLGFPVVPAKGRVLYLAMDRPRQAARAMRRLFANCTDAERSVLAQRLVVWKGPLPAPLLTHPTLLRDLARHFGADAIIVDSLKDAVAKLSDDEHGANYNTAVQLCLVDGIQVCDLHHPRKANAENATKPKGVDDIFGSTWLTAGHGSIVNLWGKTGDLVVELSMLKMVNEEVGPLQVVHDHEAGVSHVQVGFDMLEYLVSCGSLTAQQGAAAMVGGVPKSNDVERARRRLKRLEKAGLAAAGSAGERGGSAASWVPTASGRDVAAKSRKREAEQGVSGLGCGTGQWSASPF